MVLEAGIASVEFRGSFDGAATLTGSTYEAGMGFTTTLTRQSLAPVTRAVRAETRPMPIPMLGAAPMSP